MLLVLECLELPQRLGAYAAWLEHDRYTLHLPHSTQLHQLVAGRYTLHLWKKTKEWQNEPPPEPKPHVYARVELEIVAGETRTVDASALW